MSEEDDDLHRPLYTRGRARQCAEQGGNRPLLHLKDGPTLTVTRCAMPPASSCRRCRVLGRRGSRVALISPNRPECLHVTHAVQMLAAIYVPLHPLSGLGRPFERDQGCGGQCTDLRRRALRATSRRDRQGSAGIRLMAFGKSALGEDIFKLADRFAPAKLVPPRGGAARHHAHGVFGRHHWKA
jgi:fatty-acyl-CoA synthase